MILTCPECATRFAVGDDKLRPDGRKVKCGKCAHIWFQEPPPPEPVDDDEHDFDQDPIAVTPLDPEEQSPYRPTNLPSIREPERRSVARGAWVVVAVLLAAVVAIAWFGRVPIVRALPEAEAAYLAAGLRVFPEPGEGLSAEFSPRRQEDKLVVSGTITNTSDEDRTVPPFFVAVYDDGKSLVMVVEQTVATPRLGPGENVPFSAEIDPVPDNAQVVNVLFTNPGENP